MRKATLGFLVLLGCSTSHTTAGPQDAAPPPLPNAPASSAEAEPVPAAVVLKYEREAIPVLREVQKRSVAAAAGRTGPADLTDGCMSRMRREWGILKPIQARLSQFPLDVGGVGYLRAAADLVQACADCSASKSSRDACGQALEEIRNAEKDIAEEEKDRRDAGH